MEDRMANDVIWSKLRHKNNRDSFGIKLLTLWVRFPFQSDQAAPGYLKLTGATNVLGRSGPVGNYSFKLKLQRENMKRTLISNSRFLLIWFSVCSIKL